MNTCYQAIKISERVYWVGAIDNTLRDFHGYSTPRGTTYNAYLILGAKNILIDTVKAQFFPEMLARISSIIKPEKIDYLISNHAEMDHSGALLPTIQAIQPEKIFTSKMGASSLQEHFHQKLDLTTITSGKTFTLGDANLTCLETRMLHWPDSMMTYFANDGVVFSQDGFGMHLASYKIFANQNNRDILLHEAMKYFANILLPYASLVKQLLTSLAHLELEIKILAPDHGPIWHTKEDIKWIIDLWQTWAMQTPSNKIVIAYDTMWGSTAKIATAIAEGAMAEQICPKVMPIANSHRSDIATELLGAGALVIGSPTINQQIFPTVADTLYYLKGLKFKNLQGQVFGSYGWSGEASTILQTELQAMQTALIGEPFKVKYVPNDEYLCTARTLGQNIARKLKQ